MSIRLYVGNLPKEQVERQELAALFSGLDESITTKVITDRKTGKCRGFAFVTVKSEEQADLVIEKFNNFAFQDTTLQIERAKPREKGKEDDAEGTPSAEATPTPVAARKKGGAAAKTRTKAGGSTESEAVQPDPRWAQDLEKLKQLLAAQTASS